jgi:hypothetical protein
MAGGNQRKLIVLGVLAVVCAVLVWKNLIAPMHSSDEGAIATTSAAAPAANLPAQPAPDVAADSPRRDRNGDKILDRQELSALDPTLRLDLLDKTEKISYQGGTRNIFQFYTPPPKPVTNPIVAPPQPAAPQTPQAPPPPTIALKFYGISSHPGTTDKRAFLTDGDEIFIGREGEIVAKRYKIVRIGINSLDWEDMQTHQHGQLPLVEE